MVPQVTKGIATLEITLEKAITRHSRKDSSKVHKFKDLLHGVYVGTHALNDHAEGRCGSVSIFVNKNFMIVKSLTKITKILLLEMFQLYGILLAIVFHHVLSLLISYHTFIFTQ